MNHTAPRWRLRTLGGSSLLRDGVAVSGASAQPRRLALLAILAAAGDTGVSRDKLLALLWPESDADSARHALSQLLFLVRRDLQNVPFVVGTAELRLNAEEISSDVMELESAIAADDNARVVELYEGPFLDGFHLRGAQEFEHWQEEQRIRYARHLGAALERLATSAEFIGENVTAAGYRRRLAAIDPLNARVALSLMRSLVASGDIAGALQHARVHELLLAEEVGVAADPAITSFATELRRRSNSPAPVAASAAKDAPLMFGEPRSRLSDPMTVVAAQRRALRRRWLFAAVALGLVIGGGVLFAVSRRVIQLDQRLVAVAPFEVLDPQLALWREGMMDVLARALDGAGPLRSVPPSAVVREWSGGSDVASAVALGRRTGASLVVLGSLLRSGHDSVRGTVTLVSVASSNILAERETRDNLDHVDRVADSLAIALLRDIGVGQAVASVRGVSLGASTLPALKAFLRGEQMYRRGDRGSAYVLYARAVELDSNFALAVHQLSSTGWTGIPAPIDSFYRQHAIRAQRLNHGLPRRDSLLILLDSLRVVGETNPFYGTPEVPVRNAQRMLTIARQAAEDYPTDPEVLYELGEIRVHYSTVLGTKAHEARADFDRAIASDSAFAPAYEHLVSLALADQDTAGAMRYLQAMKAHAASTPVGRSATVLELGLNGRLGSRWSVAVLDSLPLEPLATALGSMFHWMDSAETATHLEQYLVAREARERPTLVPAFTTALALALSERGHLRAAYAAYAHGAQEHPRLFAEMALLGAVPADVANRTFHGWLTDDDLLRAARAAPWWAQCGDRESLNTLLARGRQYHPPTDSMRVGQYVEWTARLYLALARSDTTDALRACAATSADALPLQFLEDVDCGRLLIARGRYREAESRLTPTLENLGPLQRVVRTLQWARAAEGAGDRASAEKGYAFVRAAWRSADESLAHWMGPVGR